ncbi:LacI family DNA-binding transcriptional regulator [Puniceibacterium confluentis]|uniref:LacI family DNA-binding transcriptional regulator n=1 Tax=Puniceibacterium confluentis TaxID=1958944 RepID=UPI0011B3E4E9|nr:LacI family DNA-binding transcriptional regulator [Puniceibacterium confluentis]
MTRQTKPRLSDVAKLAGVSLGTASNVFSYPAKVRPEVRERVHAAAERLHYLGPDPAARLMRRGKVNAIGIVAPAQFRTADALRNPSFQMFMCGVAEVCDEEGTNVVIIPDPAVSPAINSALVDAFIFGQVEHLSVARPAEMRKLPFVVVDFDGGEGVNSVRIDARTGGYLAAKHLLDLGHRRFAVMSFLRTFDPAIYHPPGPQRDGSIAGMPIDREKMEGYRRAFAEHGLNIDDIPVVQAHPWDKSAAALLLHHAPDATALLSMAAMQGVSLIAEAKRRGRRVPDDLSVVGFNDIPEAQHSDPPLTVIDARNAEKGRIAARMVFNPCQPTAKMLNPSLVVRGSTAPAMLSNRQS